MSTSTRPGFAVPPRWWIAPSPTAHGHSSPTVLDLFLTPGPAFGDGTHPTTQLCLQAIAALAPRAPCWRMLDFGAGSAILSVAAARLGARVDAVEIDPVALSHAAGVADANAVADRIRFGVTLDSAPGPHDLVVANILRSVLLDFALPLTARLAPGATLVLSGLVSTDVPELTARYAPLLSDRRPDVSARGPWRALVWRGIEPRTCEK